MFYPRYDFGRGRLRPASRRVAAMSTAQMRPRGRRRRADLDNALGGLYGAGGSFFQPYTPLYERAEDPTLAEEFLPTDRQSQNKIFRNLVMFDAVAGPATEYWCELAFGQHLRLGGLKDPKIRQFYQDAIVASNIEVRIREMLHSYLVFGNFTAEFVPDDQHDYWSDIVIHDPDYVEVKVSAFPSDAPIVNVQPTNEIQAWATSPDPRAIEQRARRDPKIIKLMAMGDPYPLDAENTLYMARKVFATDYYGTSYLTRIMPFKLIEKALLDSEIAAARRRAGPVWVIGVPEDYQEEEIREIMDQFFAIEEDAIGGKVAIRGDCTVTPMGGGKADFWTLSDEYDFLRTAKMNALGVSDAFTSGEATYASMDVVLNVFLEKLRSVRELFNRTVVVDKMLKTLARVNGFVYGKSKTQVAHHYRMARKHISDAELIIPEIEWDRSLEPRGDQQYWDLLQKLEEKGIHINLATWAQAGGYDLDETFENAQSDLTDRAKMYVIKGAVMAQAEAAGFDLEGNPAGGSEIGGGPFGGGGGGLGGPETELGPPMEGGGIELGPEERGGGGGGAAPAGGAPPPAAELPAPGGAPAGAPEAPAPAGGAGAALVAPRFNAPSRPSRMRLGAPVYQDIEESLSPIQVWDYRDTAFGVPRRRVAQLLDQVAHREPRDRTPRVLTRWLLKQGLTPLQSEIVQYCGARLGISPVLRLSNTTLKYLEGFLVDQADQYGWNTAMTREAEILARIAQVPNKTPVAGYRNLTSVQADLPDSQILTGV